MAKEMAGRERAIITGFAAEDKPVNQSDLQTWMQMSKGQDALLSAFKYQITEEILKEFRTKMSEANIKAVVDIRKQISENLTQGNFGLKPELVFSATTRRIDDLKKDIMKRFYRGRRAVLNINVQDIGHGALSAAIVAGAGLSASARHHSP